MRLNTLLQKQINHSRVSIKDLGKELGSQMIQQGREAGATYVSALNRKNTKVMYNGERDLRTAQLKRSSNAQWLQDTMSLAAQPLIKGKNIKLTF